MPDKEDSVRTYASVVVFPRLQMRIRRTPRKRFKVIEASPILDCHDFAPSDPFARNLSPVSAAWEASPSKRVSICGSPRFG